MIIYNVTVNVEKEIANEWLQWMKGIHIPNVLKTDCFTSYKILKMLNEHTDVEGLTYAVQYFATDIKIINTYFSQFAPKLQNEVFKKYGERVVAFRTLLEEV